MRKKIIYKEDGKYCKDCVLATPQESFRKINGEYIIYRCPHREYAFGCWDTSTCGEFTPKISELDI